MKKTFFTALRAMCVGAMTLAAVSCYDDSFLRSELEELGDEVAGLASRLDSLETKLNREVKTLNDLVAALDAPVQNSELAASVSNLTAKLDALDGKLDGYIESNDAALAAAIEEYKKADEALAGVDTEILAALVQVGVTNVAKNADGDVVLTFVNGETLVVPANPTEGLVTVVEVDGVKYWAVVVEGEVVSLEVPVGHNDLQFQVEDNELFFSVDGGATWNSTGAVIPEDLSSLIDFYQGETDEIDWDTYEYIKEDFYTLVFAGEEYYLPIYKVDNSVITLKSGKTYFKFGETKEVDLKVIEISDLYVMNKPDAWKVKIQGKTLVVTAPSEELVTLGVADLEGEVLLHATTAEGQCKVVKFSVATGSGLTVSVSSTGDITISNPVLVESQDYDPLEGYVTTYGFASLMVGLAEIDEFAANPAKYVDDCFQGNNWEAAYTYFDNFRWSMYDEDDNLLYPPVDYVEGECEVDVVTFPIADFYKFTQYSQIPAGKHFVVWAVPMDASGAINADELVYTYYEPVQVEVELVEAKFNEIYVDVTLNGAEKFLLGFINDSYFSQYGFSFDEFMQMGEGPFGQFVNVGAMGGMYAEWAEMYMGLAVADGTAGEYAVSSLNADGYADVLIPGEKYYVWAMPVVAGLGYGEYTYEKNFKPYVFEFETAPLEYSANVDIPVTVEYTVTPVSANVEIDVDGAEMIYYAWFESDVDVNEMETAELVAEVVANGTPRNEYPVTLNETRLEPETTRTLVVVAVDENGCYGDPEIVAVTTSPIPYTDEYSVALTALDLTTANNATATFAVTGAAQKVVCYPAYYETYTTNFVNWLLQYPALEYYAFKKADVVDGVATVTGLNHSSSKYLIYCAWSADEDGNIAFTEPQVINTTTWTPAE